jgi:hypothetical protein
MLEFIVKMGLATGGSVLVVTFIVVFLLAEPGKEILFWGIKFHKKWKSRIRKKYFWRPLPKKLPNTWKHILQAFISLDSNHVRENSLFQEANRIAGFSELKTREICVEMGKYSLIEYRANHYKTKR